MLECLNPKKIYSIDITDSHIEFAQKRAAELGLSDRVIFNKMDACKTDFPSESFSHVLGIEGPAHFNTREDFFRESYRVLKKGGVLVLTDILSNTENFIHSRIKLKIAKLCSIHWHQPIENWADANKYRAQLEKAGFKVEILNVIGGMVYPGFSGYNTRIRSICNAIRIRGFFVGLGLTFISWLLGYVYAKKMVDYVYVKAVK
jgi:ubiquinone/menaquinone biosynthesis C-methylase UbiE